MPLPMSPVDSVFLMIESREHPMHVGSLLLFRPPEGCDALDVRAGFDAAVAGGDAAPLFRKRPTRSMATLGQWSWQPDRRFDLEHHIRNDALPQPGRVLELLALCSRLHSTLLDRHRPLWELHLIEGLADGRFAAYFKVHHAMVDGVSALRLLAQSFSTDPEARDLPGPWALRTPPRARRSANASTGEAGATALPSSLLHSARELGLDAVGILPALVRTVRRSLNEQSAAMSFSAPKTMFNVPITGARRFAAQSWPFDRVRRIATSAGVTVNDVVLAMCSGTLRSYLLAADALPDAPLIAMVPVSLHRRTGYSADGGGNAVGVVMCNLGTHLADPADRLSTVHRSMAEGKASLGGMSPLQILAMAALGMSPVVIAPLLRLTGSVRPPFNVVISNVPGPRQPLYWNGARLDGLYPLSIPVEGQALNITVTSYSDEIAFGLTCCRRTVPHVQRMLGYLDDELRLLEKVVGIA
jgi:diacylglycerol O-acyltransferase